MISVTDMTGYLFCPRSVYLKRIVAVEPIPKAALVKGGITHNVLDIVSKKDEEIVKKLTKVNINDVSNIYKNEFYKTVVEVLHKERVNIKNVDLNKLALFNEIWGIFLKEADVRSKSVFNFHKRTGLVGDELWNSLEPKFLTELRLESENLRIKGIIDRVEVLQEGYVPVEVKTGKMSSDGVWPGHKIQIGSYIMLLNEKFKSEYGYVDYLEHGERRKVVMDERLGGEIFRLRDSVIGLMNSKELPQKVMNENKCNNCQFRDECFKM